MQIHKDTPNVYHLQGKTRKGMEVQAIHKSPWNHCNILKYHSIQEHYIQKYTVFVTETNEKAVKARGFHYFQQTLCKETDSILLKFPYKSMPIHPLCFRIFQFYTWQWDLAEYVTDLYHFFLKEF